MLPAEFDPAKDAVIDPDMVIKAVPDFPEADSKEKIALLAFALAWRIAQRGTT